MEDHIPIKLDRSLLLGRQTSGLYGMWSSMIITLIAILLSFSKMSFPSDGSEERKYLYKFCSTIHNLDWTFNNMDMKFDHFYTTLLNHGILFVCNWD